MKLESKFRIPSRIFGEKEIAKSQPFHCYVPLEADNFISSNSFFVTSFFILLTDEKNCLRSVRRKTVSLFHIGKCVFWSY